MSDTPKSHQQGMIDGIELWGRVCGNRVIVIVVLSEVSGVRMLPVKILPNSSQQKCLVS